jgi:hypothetical protein
LLKVGLLDVYPARRERGVGYVKLPAHVGWYCKESFERVLSKLWPTRSESWTTHDH